MRRIGFKVGLFAILLFYSLLYMATTKKEGVCDWCQKIYDAGELFRKDRPYVFGAYPCGANACIQVRDSVPHNWDVFADTVCIYLKSQSLLNYRTIIMNQRGDTLADKKCP